MGVVFILLLVLSVVYFLYNQGYFGFGVKYSNISKFLINFKNVKYSSNCKFKSYTGNFKRILKLKEDKTYNFNLDCLVSNGTFNIDILDNKGNVLLSLNEINKKGAINIIKNKRYYIVSHFNNSSGEYNLTWV